MKGGAIKTLHILKSDRDRYPLELIRRTPPSEACAVILIQDAIDLDLHGIDAAILVLSDDLKKGQTAVYPKIGYQDMLQMIFEADAVLCW
ncbi:MAG: hypothetical protein ACE5GK_09530 [Nitrospiria bacterium]